MSDQSKGDTDLSVLRAMLSLAVIGFLAWTLASPTFLDVSSSLARKSLHQLSLMSSRAEAKVNSMSLQLMR